MSDGAWPRLCVWLWLCVWLCLFVFVWLCVFVCVCPGSGSEEAHETTAAAGGVVAVCGGPPHAAVDVVGTVGRAHAHIPRPCRVAVHAALSWLPTAGRHGVLPDAQRLLERGVEGALAHHGATPPCCVTDTRVCVRVGGGCT